MLSIVFSIAAGSPVLAAAQDSAEVPAANADGTETIVIRADRAWEEPDQEQVLHFAGHFELISPDWELRSEEAELYGPLDDPDRIVARGDPAHLAIISEGERIVGTGAAIEYQRDGDILKLTGDAALTGERISMKSDEIVYDVGAERLKSSGSQGVEMVLERAKPD